MSLYFKTLYLKSNNDYEVKVQTVNFNLRVYSSYRLNRLEMTTLFVRGPFILGEQRYWDNFTYIVIK
jgi:hypothetical protein